MALNSEGTRRSLMGNMREKRLCAPPTDLEGGQKLIRCSSSVKSDRGRPGRSTLNQNLSFKNILGLQIRELLLSLHYSKPYLYNTMGSV